MGNLAQSLSHPRFKIDKQYLVALDRPFDWGEDSKSLLSGFEIEEGFARAVSLDALSPRRVLVVLNQGYKRQLRQMFDALGYSVKSLIRLRIGSFELGDLASGRWRILRPEEIGSLTTNLAKPGHSRRVGRRVSR